MPAGKDEHQAPDHHEHVAVDMAPL